MCHVRSIAVCDRARGWTSFAKKSFINLVQENLLQKTIFISNIDKGVVLLIETKLINYKCFHMRPSVGGSCGRKRGGAGRCMSGATFLKLTRWVHGTNPSTFERKRARAEKKGAQINCDRARAGRGRTFCAGVMRPKTRRRGQVHVRSVPPEHPLHDSASSRPPAH